MSLKFNFILSFLPRLCSNPFTLTWPKQFCLDPVPDRTLTASRSGAPTPCRQAAASLRGHGGGAASELATQNLSTVPARRSLRPGLFGLTQRSWVSSSEPNTVRCGGCSPGLRPRAYGYPTRLSPPGRGGGFNVSCRPATSGVRSARWVLFSSIQTPLFCEIVGPYARVWVLDIELTLFFLPSHARTPKNKTKQ